jgi:hypothetical protein
MLGFWVKDEGWNVWTPSGCTINRIMCFCRLLFCSDLVNFKWMWHLIRSLLRNIDPHGSSVTIYSLIAGYYCLYDNIWIIVFDERLREVYGPAWTHLPDRVFVRSSRDQPTELHQVLIPFKYDIQITIPNHRCTYFKKAIFTDISDSVYQPKLPQISHTRPFPFLSSIGHDSSRSSASSILRKPGLGFGRQWVDVLRSHAERRVL